ncbi:acyltransferase family protein [Lysinibacillus xylanilyticus]|uniref:acyltransferase family protein n=1 Tax=Lysinibacillus xylanilyticus TaxID=582475 RepID=UPI003CFFC191
MVIYSKKNEGVEEKPTQGRYEELDSLRGLAALAVFLGHILLIFNLSFYALVLFEFGPFRVFVAGSEAVMLFFILSGFVLSLPFYKKKPFTYNTYIIKRVCRIYVPYIFAICLAFVCKELFYDGRIASLSDWFNGLWDTKITFKEMVNHLLLVTNFSSNLNVVVWSLVHEMRISFVFPFVLLILIRIDSVKGIILAFSCSIISVFFVFLTSAEYLGTELFVSIHYLALFIVGALLAKHRKYLINCYKNLSKNFKILFFFIGIILYVYAHPSFVLNLLIPDFHPFYRTVIDSWFISAGACILIISALSSGTFSRLLNNKIINYLGKISYSLYLTHIVVLTSAMYIFSDIMPLWSVCLIAIIFTFAISSVMYEIVEKNAIKLGKYLENYMKKRIKKNVINKNEEINL